MISNRAVRVSTHEIRMSILPCVFLVTYSVDACQFSPQNKLSRLTKTVDLNKPISDSENGCRTQLLAETLSPSATITCRPGWPIAVSAWYSKGKPPMRAAPVPPQPTTATLYIARERLSLWTTGFMVYAASPANCCKVCLAGTRYSLGNRSLPANSVHRPMKPPE